MKEIRDKKLENFHCWSIDDEMILMQNLVARTVNDIKISAKFSNE